MPAVTSWLIYGTETGIPRVCALEFQRLYLGFRKIGAINKPLGILGTPVREVWLEEIVVLRGISVTCGRFCGVARCICLTRGRCSQVMRPSPLESRHFRPEYLASCATRKRNRSGHDPESATRKGITGPIRYDCMAAGKTSSDMGCPVVPWACACGGKPRNYVGRGMSGAVAEVVELIRNCVRRGRVLLFLPRVWGTTDSVWAG